MLAIHTSFGQLTLEAPALAFALALLSSPALAQFETVLGTNDVTSAVDDFGVDLSSSTFVGAAVFNQSIGFPSETNPARPRGITLDRVRDDVYVGYSRPNSEEPAGFPGNNVIQVFGTDSVLKRRFLVDNLEQMNGLRYDPQNDRLLLTNGYVYGGVLVQGSDPNVYVIDDVSTVADGATVTAAVFTTLTGFDPVNFNDMEFHPVDGRLYVIRQTGPFGAGPGFVERFDASTGVHYDSDGLGDAMFGLAFDVAGNRYYGLGLDIYKQPFTGIDGSGFATFGPATLLANLPTLLCDIHISPTSGLLYAGGFTVKSVFMLDPVTGALLDDIHGPQSNPKTDYLESFPSCLSVASNTVVADSGGNNMPFSISESPPGNLPTVGNATFAIELNDSGSCGGPIPAGAPVALALNWAPGSLLLPGWGCAPGVPGELQVSLTTLPVLVGPAIWPGGSIVFALPIPGNSALCGCGIHAQGVWGDGFGVTLPAGPVMLSWMINSAIGL